MQITKLPVASLKPWPGNPRKFTDYDIKKVALSLERYGLRQPIVIDKNNFIIVGHLRLSAAKHLGWTEIDCHVADLSEELAREYRIADNSTHDLAEWDSELLQKELSLICEPSLLLAMNDLSEILGGGTKDKPEVADDNFARLDKARFEIKLGDVIELGVHRLICADSRDEASVKRLIAESLPVLMVTDPPYGVNYDPEWREGYDLGKAGRAVGKVQNDDIIDWTEVFKLWNAPVIYCWLASWYIAQVQTGLERIGYKYISLLIWAKQHFTLGRGDYHWQHEPCLYMAQGKHGWNGARDQSTLWEINNNNSFGGGGEETWGHSTQKPLECMARPIRNNSKEGDIIVDPFLGSGTTLIAAEALNRRCYGAEISPIYCSMIIERYIAYRKAQNLEPQVLVNSMPLAI